MTKTFVWANAEINGNSVIVWSDCHARRINLRLFDAAGGLAMTQVRKTQVRNDGVAEKKTNGTNENYNDLLLAHNANQFDGAVKRGFTWS
ncbi:MAG: hypothetical protein H7Y31_03495 [Chitinophagaceae bacterium]|nr:hypothetical protein [Chitinophagaceae bacterium]